MSHNLFSGIELAGQQLKNRMAMAPMTRNRAPNNVATAMMAEYYGQRAGAGLIITEGAQISEQAVGYPATPGIYSEAQVENWKQVTAAVHARGGHIFVQLWHCGRISHPDFHHGDLPVSASAIAANGDAFTPSGPKPFVTPHALEASEIPGVVSDYRHAAAAAMAADFDGVEIHAANGYLIDQFLRDGTNHRSDRYGGSLENRSRLLSEVVAAVGDEIGYNKVGVRISPINGFNDMYDSDPQTTFNHVAANLNGLGLAYLHVVEISMSGEAEVGFNARELRDYFDGIYIANGGYDRERAEQAIRTNAADMVSFGIPFIANPDLPERFRRHASLNEADPSTFYGGGEHGYTDYPSLEKN